VLKGGYSAVLNMSNTNPTLDSFNVLQLGKSQVQVHEEDYGVKVLWSAAITKHLNSNQTTDFESLVKAGVSAFTNDGHGGSMAPGAIQRKLNATPYPEEPEWKMVERDIRILRKFPKARYHVLHVSTAKTLDFVREAKKEGLLVTAEVSRSKSDQEALWLALIDGTIDFVATDPTFN
jgi:dihydroorotase